VTSSPELWRERYSAFAARKTQGATAASLVRYTTELDAPDQDLIAIANDWSRTLFDGPFYLSPAREPSRPACSLVFVQSADGNTGADDPGALGGGETDKHVIYEGLSRVAADAVMAGAETIRGGKLFFSVWHPQLVALRGELGLPRHPVQIVATLRGFALDEGLLFNTPDLRVILLTIAPISDAMHRGLSPRPWISPVIMRSPEALEEGLAQIRRLGIERISCVGGRTLARQLLQAGLIQDVYLTKSPKSGGEPNTPLTDRPLDGELIVRKHGSGADEGVVFEHLALDQANLE